MTIDNEYIKKRKDELTAQFEAVKQKVLDHEAQIRQHSEERNKGRIEMEQLRGSFAELDQVEKALTDKK